MINERVALQPAYILHSRPYRDTSALLDVLTAEHGRLTLVARGARRPGKKGGGSALQPFQPLLLSFSGRAELKTLTATETAGEAIGLRGDRLYSGLYLNELLVRLLHRHDANPQLFVAYGTALRELSAADAMDAVLRRFEVCLLEELGYRLRFDVYGLAQDTVQAAGYYRFDPEVGLQACEPTSGPGGQRYSGEDLLAMAGGKFDGEARHAAKHLLRQALAVHLGERPLNSRTLFRHGMSAASAAGSQQAPGEASRK